MAIIKCDEGLPPGDGTSDDDSGTGDGVAAESYVEQNKVSLGKTLLAVESDFFADTSLKSPLKRDTQAPFLTEKRPSGISDQFRAEFGKFWVQDTSDKESAMVFLNWSLGNQQAHEDWEGIFAPTVFELEEDGELAETSSIGSIGLSQYTQAYVATALESYWGDIIENLEASDVWTAYVQGTEAERGSFSRPTPLIPADDSTFTDHAFTMNTPFSKKELEMFANISDTVKFDVADVESDYDFFAKAYEEGIAPTNVPENALPHLYTEVQRGESEAENTIVSTTTLAGDQVEEGFFREWINTTLPNQSFMDSLIEPFENVAILDSVVDEDSILDSENKTTSAFEILMAYANRENLFPMNVNIEVGTNEASDVMFEAEEVGMVDDIVKMLMGDGDVTDSTPPEDEYDYGDWNWEDMNQLGKDLAEQGNVDYSLAEEEEKEYDWSTASIVTYYFGRNYDQANSGNWAKQAEKYEDGSFLISEAAELWRVFQKEMNKKKDFYRANWGSSFSDDELDKFFQHVFTDIDAFVEAHDRKNNDATYPSEKMRYNSLHWDPNASHNRQLPDDNHDDTEVYVTVLDDGEGKVTIKVKFWKEV